MNQKQKWGVVLQSRANNITLANKAKKYGVTFNRYGTLRGTGANTKTVKSVYHVYGTKPQLKAYVKGEGLIQEGNKYKYPRKGK